MADMDFDQSGLGAGGFATPNSTPSTSRINQSRARNDQLVPVPCSAIHELPPQADTVDIGTLQAAKVVILGVIRAANRKEGMYTEYKIDDGTSAPVLVRQWLDQFNPESTPLYEENVYVRVIGSLRHFENLTYLSAIKMAPIIDLNELSTHLLEIAYAKLFYTKDILKHQAEAAGKGGNRGTGYSGFDTNFSGSSSQGPNDLQQQQQPNRFQGAQTGLTGLNAKILSAVNAATSEAGANVHELALKFPNVPENQIRGILDSLCTEGFVYSTIDEDHFKGTD